MAAETTPCDAEIDDAARLIGAAIWRPQPCMSGNIWDRLGPLRERDCKRAALEVLLAARREADARVAAAVIAEREAIAALALQMKATALDNATGAKYHAWVEAFERDAGAYEDVVDAIRARPAPDHASTLATLLAEAREQGRREMREMAAGACVEEAALWTTKDIKVGLLLGEEAIRALPVTIPTPEAPQ